MNVRLLQIAIWTGFFHSAYAQRVVAQPVDFETTISQPVVNEPIHHYPDIAFQPGDRIFLDAGGCVQTGGHGKTWKRYVDPSGEAADRLYHGLVSIPGVTPGLVRIGGVVNRPLDMPTGMGSWPPLHLTLGYEDSDGDYGDNGYWGHDDGTEDQCKGVGAAFVIIRIKHGVNAAQGTADTTGAKDFDLKWDSADPNGYPFNPRWHYALENQATIKDPAPQCNGFAWTQQGVDPGPNCVSLKLANDSLGYWKHHIPLIPLCKNDLRIRGHVNWGEVTYEGPVRFEKFDTPEVFLHGSFPFAGGGGDDDVNLALFPLHVAKAPIVPGNHENLDNPDGFPQDVGTIGLEFDSDETIDYFHGNSWWQNFIAHPHCKVEEPGGCTKDGCIECEDRDGHTVGKDAVVSGILGLDTVHGFTTEIHPVHAIAIRSKEDVNTSTGRVVEEWGYFVRNWGNEGECSQERLHPAPFADVKPSPGGEFIFRLPWRKGMDLANFYRGEWKSNGLPNSFFPSQSIIKDANGVPQAVAIEFDGFPDPQQKAWVAGSFSLDWKPAPEVPDVAAIMAVIFPPPAVPDGELFVPLKWLTW